MAAKRTYGVTNFIPDGRRQTILYAVVVRDHPNVVKVGRTTNWKQRRKEYTHWNLRDGDGILCERFFEINEEHANLDQLEREALERMPVEPFRGKEYFKASVEEAVEVIDRLLVQGDIAFTYFERDAEE